MSKAILVMDMPTCCDECFALDDYGDYPACRITQEQRGYTFNTRVRKMDKCPLKELPEKIKYHDGTCNGQVNGWNLCPEEILKENNQMKVKDILNLLPENQETQVHCMDYGHYSSSYPIGLLTMGERIPNATVTRIETDYIEFCKCTVVKIYTDLKMGG